jgi:predicted MPP superfamily phosphohydrolase
MTIRRRWRRWRLLVLAAFVVAVAVLAYGFAETYRVEVKEYTFASPDLPANFDGTRIVLVTDIHRGPFLSQSRVRALVDRVNALQPDIVVLGGDYVYRGTGYAASCFAELERLRAPLGRFAVLGNHDYGNYDNGGDGPAPVIRAIKDAGITFLRDQAVWVEKDGERIRIGGVSDYGVDKPQLAPILEGTSSSDFMLLVSHNPDYAEKLPAGAVDLVLSGHTHGGQVTFFGLWAFHVPSAYGQKYRTGLVTTKATTVIVSNGIGTSTIPPIRLFARPQIVVITLRHAAAANPHL